MSNGRQRFLDETHQGLTRFFRPLISHHGLVTSDAVLTPIPNEPQGHPRGSPDPAHDLQISQFLWTGLCYCSAVDVRRVAQLPDSQGSL